MSNPERRRQQRVERKKKRRQATAPAVYEPANGASMPGAFGWIQRNGRAFYIVGITVMVLSLGAVFLGSNVGGHDGSAGTADTRDEDTAAATEHTPLDDADESDTERPISDEGAVQRVYAAAPPFTIDPNSKFEALIRTEKGDVRVQLLAEDAPNYVNNFVFLAENDFYDGLTFHRVLPGFVAQAGDPTGTGFTGPGYTLDEELNDLSFDEGVLSMAKAGSTVDGSQFFITLDAQPALEPNFTVFGRVTEGMDVLRALTTRDPAQAGQAPGDLILGIEIITSAATAAAGDDGEDS